MCESPYRVDGKCPNCGEVPGLFRPCGQTAYGIKRKLPPRTTWYCLVCGSEGPPNEVARLKMLLEMKLP